jgi:hypothetical protein
VDSGQASDQNERVIVSVAVLIENSIRRSLRVLSSRERRGKVGSDSICSKKNGVSSRDGKHGGLEGRQLGPYHSGPEKQHLLGVSAFCIGADQYALDIADTEPSHHAMFMVNKSEAQYNTASCPEFLVASFYDRDNRVVGGAS